MNSLDTGILPKTTDISGIYLTLDDQIHKYTINMNGMSQLSMNTMILMKMGLKETLAILDPYDYGPVYDIKYSYYPLLRPLDY